MKRYRLLYLIMFVLLWAGCDDSEKLTPSEGLEPGYILPQGEHDYDEKIMNWFEECGFYILYKFEPRDVYFNMGGGSLEIKVDTADVTLRYASDDVFVAGDNVYILTSETGEMYRLGEHDGYKAYFDGDEFVVEKEEIRAKGSLNGFRVDQADEEYVGKQLVWLEEVFLNHYSKDFLREYMPLKLILGKNLLTYINDLTPPEVSGFIVVSNVFVVSYGDETQDNMSDYDKWESKSKMNKWFLSEKLFDKIYKVAEAEGFFSFTDYDYLVTIWLQDNSYYPNGLVNYEDNIVGWGQNATRMKQVDLKSYLCMVVDHSFDMLNDEALSGDYDRNDCTGIFDEKKDSGGLIREKYDVLVKALNDIGIDLQGIGNMYAPY